MFIKKDRKAKKRYPGTDISPWRVVTYSGEELGRYEAFKDPKTTKVSWAWTTRWNGYNTANVAAVALGGVAIRA